MELQDKDFLFEVGKFLDSEFADLSSPSAFANSFYDVYSKAGYKVNKKQVASAFRQAFA